MIETKVCVINDEEIDLCKSVNDLSDDEFMSIAEESGSVYSLKEFENIFNDNESEEELNPDYHFIRFIKVYKGE